MSLRIPYDTIKETVKKAFLNVLNDFMNEVAK